MIRPIRLGLALVAAIALAGCQTTPTAPPTVDVPTATLAQPPLDLDRWWTAFDDPALERLIAQALARNLDLAVAMARIDLARANVRLARADLFPDVNLQVGASRERTTTAGSRTFAQNTETPANNHRIALGVAYELDLWGKYRSATQAARESLLATQFARDTVQAAVVAEVARAYFSLAAADAELKLLRDTLKLREESVGLQRDRFEAGVVGELDLRQAQAERAAIVASIANAERAIGLLEGTLAVLTGGSPRDVYAPAIARGTSAQQLLAVPRVPEGLPSGLLERRPDVRRSEAELAAASLRVDVARADYFPSVSLTGLLGSESASLSNLFSGSAFVWSIGASLLQQLSGIKVVEANVEAQRARREEAIVVYRQTVQTAFRETHDALVAHRTARDALAAQTQRREALRHALELADLRYRAGYSGYLEVLDAQRQLLQAQTQEIAAARDARNALVDLAKALGGGWTPPERAAAVR